MIITIINEFGRERSKRWDSDLNESTSLWWRFSYAIDRTIDFTPQAEGGMSNVMEENENSTQYVDETQILHGSPEWERPLGGRRTSLLFVCYSVGLQYSFSFSFSGLVLSISNQLCCNE